MTGDTETREIYVEGIARVAKGAGIIFAGTVFWGAGGYLYNIYLARVLGSASYGLYSLGLAVFNIVSILSLVGMHSGLLRFVALYNSEKDQSRIKGTVFSALFIVTLVGILLGGLLFFLADVISISIFREKNLANVLRVFAVAIPFFGLMSVFVVSTQGFQVMKYHVYVRNLWESIGKICFVTILFIAGFRLFGAVAAYLLTLVVSTVLAYSFLKRLFPINRASIQPIFETRRLLIFSLPLFLVSVLQIGRMRADKLILGYFQSPHDVGLYTAAFQTSILAMMILNSFNAIFTPMISDLHNRNELRKLEDLLKTVTRWIVTLTLPIFLFLLFFSREILGVFGEQFVFASLCLKILVLGQMVNSGTGSVGSVLTMSGHPKIELLNSFAAFAFEIPMCFVLIPQYGIMGAAMAAASALILLNILRVIEVYAILNIHPYKIDFIKPMAAGGILTLFLFFSRNQHFLKTDSFFALIVCIFISLILYVSFLFIFGLGQEDAFVLEKLKDKFVRTN